MSWNNTVIAVVAGDAREQEIARCAVRAGATVRAYGFPGRMRASRASITPRMRPTR
ncbi:hypothetical protein QEZ47_12280 [Aminobacter anthyllidis]|uniref:hypothetical protein n=1 Tax=Aminobacter anthyllidis TaxID=1035067 RepID=UPI0024540CE4|nr:hypothetical protein [Aminobacter anthyllidis]MDH4986299.1 hypothetical protein [Aminobacter anthyllidis]